MRVKARGSKARDAGLLARTVSNGDVAGTLSSSASYLLVRIRNIDSPAVITQRTPAQIPFVSPLELVQGPLLSLIPRALWPGKPIIVSGSEFSQDYYGLPATVITSSAITPVGDLYRHGGWIPVIIGMFLLGCGIRFLDDALDVRGSPHAAFLFVLLFPVIVNQEADWTTMLALIPGTLFVWLLAMLRLRPYPAAALRTQPPGRALAHAAGHPAARDDAADRPPDQRRARRRLARGDERPAQRAGAGQCRLRPRPAGQPAELGAGTAYARAALAFADASLDYALIDGAYHEHTARHVLPKIKPGGILIIDNVNWYLPSVTRSPSSRTPDLGPAGPVWTEIAAELAQWRRIWTSSGVWDTAIFVRPGT